MKRTRRRATIALVLCAACTRGAGANPIPITRELAPLGVLLLFPLEGLLLTKLARTSGARMYRFVAVWTVITVATTPLFFMFPEGTAAHLGRAAGIGIGGGVVVFIEAVCARGLLGSPMFVRSPGARPGFGKVLAWSLIVNAASLAAGFLLLGRG